MKKVIYATSSALSSLLVSPLAVLAQGDITIPQIPKPPQVRILDIEKLLGALIGLILIIAALVFFFMLVIGGVQWIVSGGDKAATEAARGRITAALIGLVIVFAAWAIVKLIEQFLGITIISGPIIIPRPY